MGLIQKIAHDLTKEKSDPISITEGAHSQWETFFAWLPTREFDTFEGFGRRHWLRTMERRIRRSAMWLHPGPQHWPEYRLPADPDARKENPPA